MHTVVAAFIHWHAFHLEVQVSHAFLCLFAEVLLALTELLRRLLAIIGSLKLLMTATDVVLRCLGMIPTVASAHVHLDHLFDLWVIECLPHLVDLYLDNLSRVIVFILGRHTLSILELRDVHSEVPHAVNILFDLLGVVEAFLKHSLLFDLLKNADLRYDFSVHPVKISRLSHL